MNWLGDEIGEMGAEPDMRKADYPYEGTSNAALLRSYIEFEEDLIKMYEEQAAGVEDRELKRILLQLGWESLTHRRRFQSWLEKLGPEGEEPLEFEEAAFSPDMMQRFHKEVDEQYKLVLQQLRHAFVFEDFICPVGSEVELSAMRHMKHMSHFAEELSEMGEELPFDYPGVDMSRAVLPALASDLELTEEARERFTVLAQDPELEDHPDLVIEIDNMVTRNGLLATVTRELMEEAEEAAAKKAPAPTPPQPVESKPDKEPKPSAGQFTVGSLRLREE